jgi:plasmid stability protein
MSVIEFPSFEIVVPLSPDEMEALQARARRHDRSLRQEVEIIVQQGLARDTPRLEASEKPPSG